VLQAVAFLIVTAGFVGEASAVFALYQGHDDSTTRLTVFLATMILIFAVVTGPLTAYIRVTLSLQRARGPAPRQDAAGDSPALQPAATRQVPENPEPAEAGQAQVESGKTDPV
jgi:hypothetical protein